MDAQDEAARRREARRQKILARGSTRMNKIMGVTPAEKEPVAEPFVIDSMRRASAEADQEQTTENLVTSSQARYEEYDRTQSAPAEYEPRHAPSEADPLGPVETRRTRPTRLAQARANANANDNNRVIPTEAPALASDSSGLPPQLANLLQTLQSQGLPEEGAEDEAVQARSKTFSKVRTLLSLIVGILIRLSFLTSLGPDYVQTAINPFVAFEIAIIGYQRAVGMSLAGQVKGGLWLSALALSGINQDIINTYKQTMGVVSAILDDFTIYFFAFTAVHLFV